VYSVALEILQNEGEAEEVLQQVFVDVWDNIDSYDETPSLPFVWLVCNARALAIGRLRARMIPIRTTDGSPDVAGGHESTVRATRPGDAVLHLEECPEFIAALNQLTQEQRSVIEHAYFKGRTQSELATYFGLHLESVKNLIRSGLFALRDAVEPSPAGMNSLYLEGLIALNSLGALDGTDVLEFKRLVPNVTRHESNESASYEHVAALFAVAHTEERRPPPAVKEKLLSHIR
jgi:RNA polymerase sigma-70 factor (ECF subfamily)